MARGFWTGLFHGGVVSGAALAALSLLSPMPKGDEPPAEAAPSEVVAPAETVTTPPQEAPPKAIAPQEARPEPAATAEAQTDTQPDAQPQPPSESVADRSERSPSAGAVDLPVGSEFGRGGDVAPQMPSPLAVPDGRMAPAEAPAVSAPAAEPAPVTVTGDNRRPQTEQAEGPALTVPEDGGAAPDLSRPDALALPDAPAMPQMGGVEAQDDAPARPAETEPQPAPSAETNAETATETEGATGSVEVASPASDAATNEGDNVPQPPQPAAEDASEDDAQTDLPAAPSLPSPSLDLSLPPDLSDLRKLERN